MVMQSPPARTRFISPPTRTLHSVRVGVSLPLGTASALAEQRLPVVDSLTFLTNTPSISV
jgi:hypothetical protein